MRAPEEVFKAQQQGAPQAAEELSREERTRLRAKKKRAGKKRKQQEVRCAPVHRLTSAHQAAICACTCPSLPFFLQTSCSRNAALYFVR